MGFPAGSALSGRPGLLCPRCGGAAVITAGLFSGAMVMLWAAVGIGIVATPALERLPTPERFVTVAAAVALALAIQRLAAPFLLELQRPDDGEQLTMVDARK